MRYGRHGVRKTLAAKHPEMRVVRLRAEEEEVWRGMAAGSARSAIEQVGSCVQRVRPERKWHTGMDKHGASAVVDGAQDPFGMSVLLGSVGAGEAQDNAACSEEGAKGSVVKLASIISLERHDRPA